MNKFTKIFIAIIYTIFFIQFIILRRNMTESNADCAFACRPDCNQYKVTGCDQNNPTKSECRSHGDCQEPLWDWTCCVGAAETGGNTTPIGSYDQYEGMRGVGDCRVTGWTTDSDDTTVDVNFRVLADRKNVLTGVSDNYLEDLIGVCSQGSCAFDRNIYSYIDKNYSHSIIVESRDVQTSSWVNIKGTPKSLTCSNLICTVAGPTTICPATNSTYTVRAAGTNLSATGIYLHTASSSGGLRTAICTGGASCTGNIRVPAGKYYVYCNAQVPNAPPNARCSGNPYCAVWPPETAPDEYECSDWVDCGAGDVLEINADLSACTPPS